MLLKSNVNARVKGLLWVTYEAQIFKLSVVNVMTNNFLHVNSFSLAHYSYRQQAQILHCPHGGLLSDLDHTQVSSVLTDKTGHLSSKPSFRVKQFAFIFCRQQTKNWSYTMCWDTAGTNLIFPHNSTCHLSLCLTLFLVDLILPDLPYQDIPFILSCLQGLIISRCGSPWLVVWPHHLFCPAPHLYTCFTL